MLLLTFFHWLAASAICINSLFFISSSLFFFLVPGGARRRGRGRDCTSFSNFFQTSSLPLAPTAIIGGREQRTGEEGD